MAKKYYIIVLFLFFYTVSFGQDIKNRIDHILNSIPPSTKVSVIIYDPISAKRLYERNPTLPLIPASNTKIYSTAVALSMMGGDYELSTSLLADKNSIDGDKINGNLYLKGYGNSIFSENDLFKLANELKAKGIKRITGAVLGDDSFFDNVYTRADWIEDETQNAPLPSVSALVLDRNSRAVSVVGRRGRVSTKYVSIKDPPFEIAGLLRDKLIETGIIVDRQYNKGLAPKDAVEVASVRIKLRDLISMINKRSDNFLAECLFKTIGAVSSSIEGNAFYSTQAIKTYLKDNNIYCEGTNLCDGSGLSKNNRTTTASLVGLLEKMYFDLQNYEDFYKSLSVAGEDGTLRKRMRGDDFKFAGKTGTLNGSSALSGYITTSSKRDLIISIIFQYERHADESYKDLENEIVEIAGDIK
ncbi:MAG: D-alanyl-D-alanine carboxypeptidase [Bacteroidota bacterium]|nr:D-alanyl-D-alanine carboxypeptidase [Bacteroidota bacterium]